MLTSQDYRQLAERCILLASECAVPSVADALKTLALDYLTQAVSRGVRGRLAQLSSAMERGGPLTQNPGQPQ